MSNYAISIGGSGSRCIESLIFMCAAGLGPKEMNVIFVDPDQSNGNLSKAKELLNLYNDTRKKMFESGIEFRQGDYFYTEFISRTSDTWVIFEKSNSTLKDFINYSLLEDAEAEYINTLYSKEELETPLNEGFRGHPSIGALVMSLVDFSKEPWIGLWNSMNSVQVARGTKIFLFGSIFGGTGASGLPTLAHVIKTRPEVKLNNQESKVDLGGTLLLPYFTFEMPDPEKVKEKGMFVTAHDFPLAAKAALNYYFTKKIAYDDVYLLGEVSEKELGKFSTGRAEQKNRSHHIELLAALSSLDFYHYQRPKNQTGTNYLIASRKRR
ncbi:hypothetical protein MASR2M39_29870 [Ignavibacteriales bacterium]